MRLQFIACKVMQKEAYLCAARSSNVIDIVFMKQGLHNEPDNLRAEVQKALDVTCDSNGRQYDATLLGYGLCSNGIVGLTSKIPLVVPRGHDCITLLLGSREKYQDYFDTHPGVYWYSPGWIDTDALPSKQRYEKLLEEYEKKFGPENARYLIETEHNWIEKYNYATYIDWGFPEAKKEKKFTRQCAEHLGLKYDEVKGSASLLQRLFDGDWDSDDFLVVEPGKTIAEDIGNPGIIREQ